jgi:hypothetical protein
MPGRSNADTGYSDARDADAGYANSHPGDTVASDPDASDTDTDTGRLQLRSGQRASRRHRRIAPKRGQWGEGLDCGSVGHGSTEG